MISRSRFLVAAAIVICTLSLGCTKKDAGNGAGNESGKSEVLIGHLGALSGSEATFGVNT
ncbi:MAG: ethanolamine utilization protein EutJ, partial [Proteobacteria bacterium]